MPISRITVLVENTAGKRGLLGEHGLAFWIELGRSKLLFDTGQGMILSSNAKNLDISLETAEAIVLSHGHYDHTGGLQYLLKSIGRTRFYAHPSVFERKFVREKDGAVREIGMPIQGSELLSKAELIQTLVPTEVFDGFFVTGPIPRIIDFEDTGGAFFLDQDCRQPDNLVDDQAAFFETSGGTVVILGCAHSGLINTLLYVRKLTKNRPVNMVIGGMHLVSASKDRIDKTVAELKNLGLKRLSPLHCTGPAAIALLWHEFDGRCIPGSTGTVFEFDR